MENKPTINIGFIGHVSHGKSTIVRKISGKNTIISSVEKDRNITINLGYANAKIYYCCKCDMFFSYPSDFKISKCEKCNNEISLKRHISLVDCPGHDNFMSTMINGATVMDIAILIVAANVDCPQPQTIEHIEATKTLDVKNYIVVQNKIDLVTQKNAEKNCCQIIDFMKKKTGKQFLPIPINAQANENNNISLLLKSIVSITENIKKNSNNDNLKMNIIRTFKTFILIIDILLVEMSFVAILT